MVTACVFDAYGTLFDVHSAVRRHADRLGPAGAAVSQLWRTKQLEYTWLRTLMGRYVDFATVTAEALDVALATHAVRDAELRADLLRAYLELDPYPDVIEVLHALRQRGVACSILSNGTEAMLAAAVAAAGVEALVDRVISVDPLGTYKPDPRVYRHAVEVLGRPDRDVLFVSANNWDAIGAAHAGLQVAWINRTGQEPDRLGRSAEHQLPDLRGLVALSAALGPPRGSRSAGGST